MTGGRGEESPTSKRATVTFEDEAVARRDVKLSSIPAVNVRPSTEVPLAAFGGEILAEEEAEGMKWDSDEAEAEYDEAQRREREKES